MWCVCQYWHAWRHALCTMTFSVCWLNLELNICCTSKIHTRHKQNYNWIHWSSGMRQKRWVSLTQIAIHSRILSYFVLSRFFLSLNSFSQKVIRRVVELLHQQKNKQHWKTKSIISLELTFYTQECTHTQNTFLCPPSYVVHWLNPCLRGPKATGGLASNYQIKTNLR